MTVTVTTVVVEAVAWLLEVELGTFVFSVHADERRDISSNSQDLTESAGIVPPGMQNIGNVSHRGRGAFKNMQSVSTGDSADANEVGAAAAKWQLSMVTAKTEHILMTGAMLDRT